MVDVAQILANALLLSALYTLVAIGFTMIFGIADILNVAHGAAIIVGGFSAFYTVRLLNMSIWVGAIFALIVPAIFSLVVYRVFVKPIEDDDTFVIITTLVILLITENLFRQVAGTEPQVIPQLASGTTVLGNVTLQNNRIVLFLSAWLIIIALFVFVKRTWIGRGIESLSMSPRGSALVGVDRNRATITTFGIAGALAGLAGLFFGISQGVSWDMGLDPLLIAFAIVIIGGMGSIKGSVVGAHIVGVLETLTVTLIDSRLTGVVALSVMVIIILVMPHGLYGRPGEAE
ncbi:MAG: branched-chain amino acid ABC transporter permease [Halovenus sp.]